MEFGKTYKDDAACLEWLWRERFSADGEHAECPKCERTRKFHKLTAHPAWSCDTCGHHLHPTAGTIFAKSSTSLHLWFYAMYLMASTRCGISAKQLERELGVTYKTAWRMLNLIRNQLMEQDNEPLSGDVEVDETAGGGRVRASASRRGPLFVRAKVSRRPTIWGAVERGGKVRAVVVKSRGTIDVETPIYTHVLPSSMIFTDEWKGYDHWRLSSRFIAHRRIRHEDRIYVDGTVHTQTDRGVLRPAQERHPRLVPRRVEQVASGLPERVRMALQPPRRRPRDLHGPPAPGGCRSLGNRRTGHIPCCCAPRPMLARSLGYPGTLVRYPIPCPEDQP
jgi:transposase-like protein